MGNTGTALVCQTIGSGCEPGSNLSTPVIARIRMDTQRRLTGLTRITDITRQLTLGRDSGIA